MPEWIDLSVTYVAQIRWLVYSCTYDMSLALWTELVPADPVIDITYSNRFISCPNVELWPSAITVTAQKMKFFIKDFFSKCDQIHSFLRIWSHLLKKSLTESFILYAVGRLHFSFLW